MREKGKKVLDIFIGYDPNEIVAYHVACHSILEKASQPVRITPLNLRNLGPLMTRERHALQSTEFAFSRFLVPHLVNHTGWALFMDCDMLVRTDIAELFALADDRYAVMVCQHDYSPSTQTKFLRQIQSPYPKKNWSSVMLFNSARCRKLTPDYVNTATGLELHQFKWLESDAEIGALPLEWTWLVGEYKMNPAAKIAHYTIAGPYFAEGRNGDFADEWRQTYARMISVAER